jgi:stearoyl-CoA desaturase (delta-9 desaturase)
MPDLGQVLVGIAVFTAAWTFSLVYISIFYHRALAHNAIALRPGVKRWILVSGNWVTGIDPVGWVAMHRLHHTHADGTLDPHSPSHVGVLGVAYAQLKSYERVLARLSRGHPATVARVTDLECDISWMNRRGVWWLPYVAHALVAFCLGLATGLWFVATCYWVGIMSHPVQGWAANALGHHFGRRNFDTPDDSTNNWLVALLVMGEGLQNNHHAYPASARFSARLIEPDFGYVLARLFSALGIIEIRRDLLIPRTPLTGMTSAAGPSNATGTPRGVEQCTRSQ